MIESVLQYVRSGALKKLFIYSFGALFLKGISFFLLPLYTSLLSPAEFGKLELLSTFAGILELVLSLGLAQFLFMEFYRFEPEKRAELLQRIFSLYFTLVLLLYALVFLGVALFHGVLFQDIRLWAVLVVSITTYLTFFQTIYVLILKLEMKVMVVTVFQVAFGLVAVGLNILLVYVYRTGYTGIILAGLVSMSLAAFYSMFRIAKSLGNRKPGLPGRESFGVLAYSLPFVPNMLMVWIMNSANRWVLLHYAGVTEVGLFSVAAKFSALLDPLFIQPFLNVYSPGLMQRFGNGDYRQPLLKKGLLFVPMALVISAFLVFVAWVMLDQRYYSSLPLIPVMVAGSIFGLLAQMAGTLLVFRKRVSQLLAAICIGAVCSMLGNLLLVQGIGITGSALGTTLGNACWMGAILYYFRKEKALIRREEVGA